MILEYKYDIIGGIRSAMITVFRNGHGDTSSKPGRGCLHLTLR